MSDVTVAALANNQQSNGRSHMADRDSEPGNKACLDCVQDQGVYNFIHAGANLRVAFEGCFFCSYLEKPDLLFRRKYVRPRVTRMSIAAARDRVIVKTHCGG